MLSTRAKINFITRVVVDISLWRPAQKLGDRGRTSVRGTRVQPKAILVRYFSLHKLDSLPNFPIPYSIPWRLVEPKCGPLPLFLVQVPLWIFSGLFGMIRTKNWAVIKTTVSFLSITKLTHFFDLIIYLNSLHVSSKTVRSSSGELILSIHYLVYISLKVCHPRCVVN